MCFDPDRSLIASDGDGRDDERGKKWQAKIKSGKCQRRSMNVGRARQGRSRVVEVEGSTETVIEKAEAKSNLVPESSTPQDPMLGLDAISVRGNVSHSPNSLFPSSHPSPLHKLAEDDPYSLSLRLCFSSVHISECGPG
ncbi:uncharacterized protein BDW70DRAFT_151307 [Aspergillus foveolatus]|uniref:uncharacterized protein n=1 Tax=Aspergillus foveolatus TaxID=210207 RepID=UPI003CCD8B7C